MACTMKAVRLHSKGAGTEGLVFEDAPRPSPSPNELLIRVSAAGVTPEEVNWTVWTDEDGNPRRYPIMSHEFSGIVSGLGEGVIGYRTGDEVFGFTAFERDGALAEYTIALHLEIAPKPKSASHVEAAAVPMSALTAWQALFDYADLASGQRVLIHGAAGGVGTFAVQLARWAGAHVIATASKGNLGFVRDMGAEEVLDYAVNFEDEVDDVHVVLNAAKKEVGERSMKVIRKGGTLVSIVGSPSKERARELGINVRGFVVKPSSEQLIRLAELIDKGLVVPVVQRVMPLAQAREAYELGLRGPNRGKTVLKVTEGTSRE